MDMVVTIFWSLAITAALGWGLAAYFAVRSTSKTVMPAPSIPVIDPCHHQVTTITSDDSLFGDAPMGLCQLALDGRIVRVNHKLSVLCGFDEEQLNARYLPNLLHNDDTSAINVVLGELARGSGDAREMQSRLLHALGHTVWVRLTIRLIRHRGRAIHFVAAITDISEYVLAEQIARSEHAKFSTIAAQVPVAVWLLSPDRQVIFINDALEKLVDRAKESFFANPASYLELIHPDDLDRVWQTVQAAGGGSYEMNYRILRDDGEVRYIRELGRGIYDVCGKLLYCITSATDISSEMVVRDELHELNSRLRETNLRLRESVRLDGLTRCLNRVALFDEAEKALLLARRYQRSSTLVFFDLNNFKDINDSFGHHIGDRALIAFAEQIKARLRTTDELGRYGGDEFVALLRETDAEQALQLIATLAPIIIENENGNSIILRFSAGVACSDDVGIETVDDWLRIADGLMYRQKVRLLKESVGRA